MYEFVEPHVRRLVVDHLGVDVEELVPEVSLRDDLAADPLDLVELALALEGRFGIGVPEHILDQVRSYKDLVETTVGLIRSRRAAESRSAEQPARFVARIVPSEGRSGGILEHGGWLTPYTVQTIVEDALRAGGGARLEVSVAASTEDTGLARVRDDFACLGQRGVLVTVWRENENGVPRARSCGDRSSGRTAFAPSRSSCRVRLPQWQCPVRMDALQFGPHGCFRGEHLRGVAPNGKAGFRIAGCWLPLLARPSGQGLLALASLRQKSRTPKFIGSFSRRSRELPG